jgi:hypothetical protein
MRAIFIASVFIMGAACSISTLQNLLKLKADSERRMNVMNSTLDYMMRIGNGPEQGLENFNIFQSIDTDGDGLITQQELSKYFNSIGMNYS